MSDWMDWVVDAPLNVLMVFASALVIYAALLVCSRLAGLRSFSKLSGFDFPVTVAFGSLLATVIADVLCPAQAEVSLGGRSVDEHAAPDHDRQ